MKMNRHSFEIQDILYVFEYDVMTGQYTAGWESIEVIAVSEYVWLRDRYTDRWRRWRSTLHTPLVMQLDYIVWTWSHYRLLSIPSLSGVRSLPLTHTLTQTHTPSARKRLRSCSYRAENRLSSMTHNWLHMKSSLLSLSILLILTPLWKSFTFTTASPWGVIPVVVTDHMHSTLLSGLKHFMPTYITKNK